VGGGGGVGVDRLLELVLEECDLFRDIESWPKVYIYMYKHTHIYIHAHTYIYTYIYIPGVELRSSLEGHIHLHTYIYIHTHIYIYIHMYLSQLQAFNTGVG